MPGFLVVCYTRSMTFARRFSRLALIGAAGTALARSSAAPPSGALPPVASTPARLPVNAAPSLPDVPTAADGAPVFTPALLRLRARAQERILGRGQGVEDEFGRSIPARQVAFESDNGTAEPANGNELGHFVPIENEAALSHFHQALDALANHPEQKKKLRVLAYGASHTQADIYASYLRYYLQSRFGNGGPGFIPLGLERGWSRRLDFKVRERGFKVEFVESKTPPPHGRFGLSGAAAVGGPHAWVRIAPDSSTDPELAASQYGLFYAAEPEGSEISVSVDGEEPVRLPTHAPQLEARYHTFERPLGWHDVEVRSEGRGGENRLFGLSIERLQPGLVLDTLGIRGTRAASMLLWDQSLWEEHLRRRAPDLVLLAYGTNETTDRGQPIEEYSRDLARVLGRLRKVLPDVSCVLVGPGDFPKSDHGSWMTQPRLLEIIAEQRRLAPQFGCGFWDAYGFMGGAGSMVRFVEAVPRLGAPDHIHLTARGYVRMGMELGDALMRAYDAQRVPAEARVTPQRRSEGSGERAASGEGLSPSGASMGGSAGSGTSVSGERSATAAASDSL
jgi:lysophospholipase L1-like esterase